MHSPRGGPARAQSRSLVSGDPAAERISTTSSPNVTRLPVSVRRLPVRRAGIGNLPWQRVLDPLVLVSRCEPTHGQISLRVQAVQFRGTEKPIAVGGRFAALSSPANRQIRPSECHGTGRILGDAVVDPERVDVDKAYELSSAPQCAMNRFGSICTNLSSLVAIG